VLGLELLERQVASVDALRVALRALKAGDADALCYVADAMINSQSQLVIDAAIAKSLPTMFATPENATGGALASYGVSYYAFGRLCARQVQRVLQGARPADLPVEQIDKLHFAINLRSARALRLTVPPSVLARADQVID
jgi:putative ABC transport system substrate-binding protein